MNTEHHRAPKAEPARPDWRRIHHSPLFWVGAALLAAMAIYVWSDDLSWPCV